MLHSRLWQFGAGGLAFLFEEQISGLGERKPVAVETLSAMIAIIAVVMSCMCFRIVENTEHIYIRSVNTLAAIGMIEARENWASPAIFCNSWARYVGRLL
jgi:peptidoglycan/LPS O-acetylase OafA/YrhL